MEINEKFKVSEKSNNDSFRILKLRFRESVTKNYSRHKS